MDQETKQRLLDATEPLIVADNWLEIELLWDPFVLWSDPDAKNELAYIYEWYGFDEGAEKDREMREMLEQAAVNGHAGATYRLTHLEPPGEKRDQLLRRAAELGNPHAQRDLNAYHATGDWTGPKDAGVAVYWYTRAAEQGEQDAQYNLGLMYISGEGTERDLQKGLMWLRLSAGRGQMVAMDVLSGLYREAYYGVERNIAEADRWDRRLQEAELLAKLGHV